MPVDGEEVLGKIRGFELSSWNFIGHDPKKFRHYGPMAQDFFAAFGHDGLGQIGSETTINSGDLAGILMIAVQALEKRTAELETEGGAACGAGIAVGSAGVATEPVYPAKRREKPRRQSIEKMKRSQCPCTDVVRRPALSGLKISTNRHEAYSLDDDTHGAVLAQRFQVENGFPVLDLQLPVHAFQSVLVPTHIGTRFPQAETIDEKRGSHDDTTVFCFDSYISNEAPGARRRIFSVTVAALQSFHPSAQPYHVIVDKHQVRLGISVREVRRRDHISAIGGEKRQPLIQAPCIQESRLLVKKVLHHLAQSGTLRSFPAGLASGMIALRC